MQILKYYMLFGLVLLVTLFQIANTKKVDKCKLAEHLSKHPEISRTFISNWICLAEKESGLDSSKITPYPALSQNPLYSFYGLFQISSREWCGRGFVGGDCKMKCEALLDDKYDDDIACAVKVFNRYGFKNWKEWEKQCKLKPLPDISMCWYKALLSGRQIGS